MTDNDKNGAPTPTPATDSPSFWTFGRPQWSGRFLTFFYGLALGGAVVYAAVLLGQAHYATH